MEIISVNRDFAVVFKPFGYISEEHGSAPSLPNELRKYLRENGAEFEDVYTVHRLDRTTEGLMVYALNKKSAAELSRAITEGRFVKTYRALITQDEKLPDEGGMEDYLFYDRRLEKSFAVKKEKKGAKLARLQYKLGERITLDSGAEAREAVIRLETGRTHQIRVQFGSRRSPLIGDGKYGSRVNYKKPSLRAIELSFEIFGEKFEFKIN